MQRVGLEPGTVWWETVGGNAGPRSAVTAAKAGSPKILDPEGEEGW